MAPRQAKSHDRSLPEKTLVIDNGAYTIKAGFASPEPNLEDCEVIPNCIAKDRDRRVWIGAQLDGCRDFGELAFRRPVEKGFLVNWDAEKAIWDNAFFGKHPKLRVCAPVHSYTHLSDNSLSVTLMRPISYLQKLQIPH